MRACCAHIFRTQERLFGLTGSEGNHGEDVKEYYFYLDSTPTHSYMKMLYKYPMDEYPYGLLVAENGARGRCDPEFELLDAMPLTWKRNHYFDVFIEYAKVRCAPQGGGGGDVGVTRHAVCFSRVPSQAGENDIMCAITAVNRSQDRTAPLVILPHLFFRNTWSWGYPGSTRPGMKQVGSAARPTRAAQCELLTLLACGRRRARGRWSLTSGTWAACTTPCVHQCVRQPPRAAVRSCHSSRRPRCCSRKTTRTTPNCAWPREWAVGCEGATVALTATARCVPHAQVPIWKRDALRQRRLPPLRC